MAFNVYIGKKRIETVFYSLLNSETKAEAINRVKNSLISHDGFSPEIKVTWPKGQRLTRDVWEIRGNYGYGFETECAELSAREARKRLKEYRENGPGVYRIVKIRERV